MKRDKTPATLPVAAPTAGPASGPVSAPGATAGVVRDAAASPSPARASLAYRFRRAIRHGPIPKGLLERDLGFARGRLNRIYAGQADPTLEEAGDLAAYMRARYPSDQLTRDLETALTIIEHEGTGTP